MNSANLESYKPDVTLLRGTAGMPKRAKRRNRVAPPFVAICRILTRGILAVGGLSSRRRMPVKQNAFIFKQSGKPELFEELKRKTWH